MGLFDWLLGDRSEEWYQKEMAKLIEKYKQAAYKAIIETGSLSPQTSDWNMVKYFVKNNKVIVKITDGMAG